MDKIKDLSTEEYSEVTEAFPRVCEEVDEALTNHGTLVGNVIYFGFGSECGYSNTRESLVALETKVASIAKILSDTGAMISVVGASINTDVFEEEDRIANSVRNGDN